jgi:hypothetical protein
MMTTAHEMIRQWRTIVKNMADKVFQVLSVDFVSESIPIEFWGIFPALRPAFAQVVELVG